MNRKNLISEIRTKIINWPIYLSHLFIAFLLGVVYKNYIINIIQVVLVLLSCVVLYQSLLKLNESKWETINLMTFMFLLSIDFLIIGYMVGNFDFKVLIIFILLCITAMIIGIFSEGYLWDKKVKEWVNSEKIDLVNNRINILLPWYIPKGKSNQKSTYLIYILIGMSGLFVRFFMDHSGSTLIGYIMGLSSLVVFYAVGTSIKRLSWILNYQLKNQIVFYNELDTNYKIDELFDKKKTVIKKTKNKTSE